MAGKTAQQLIRELSSRLHDLVLTTSLGTGSQTALVDQSLLQYWPEDIAQFYPWVYGTGTADTNNRFIERRAKSWSANSYTLTLHPPGFPVPVATGEYEIHLRYQRARLLAALNDGIGMLDLGWLRWVVDTSITTAQNTWKYTLPALAWQGVQDVEISVDTTFPTAPYLSAAPWDWRVYPATDASGNTTWVIQFRNQPPPNRTLRIFGWAAFNDLVSDTDVLALNERDDQIALSWIYRWAAFNLNDWQVEKIPAGMVDKYERRAFILKAEADQLKKQLAPANLGNRIVVPGRGTAQRGISGRNGDTSYFGAFSSDAVV